MKDEYRRKLQKSETHRKKIQALFATLSSAKGKSLDMNFERLHDKAFQKINCLECANCCKTTSPIFEQKDIDRISKHLKQTAGQFIREFLHMDEDGDFVLNNSPCVFLKLDNTCRIYDVRPAACAEYPHTNRKRIHEILDITYENTFICPAVSDIVSKINID